jgi:hypothetical protein
MIRENDNSKPTQLIWHYTTGRHFPSILKERKIRNESSLFIPPPQLPVTWFSLNQVWEPTAFKVSLRVKVGPMILRDANSQACDGLFRIGVDPSDAPFRTHQLIKIARADRWTVKALIRSGLRCGATPEDWRFTPNEVPDDRWRAIQLWDGESSTWVPYEHERRIPLRRDELVGAFD